MIISLRNYTYIPLILLCILLTGCGFSPMYGSNSVLQPQGVSTQINNVFVDNIPDRTGQYLRNLLIDRFYKLGRPQNPEYKLLVTDLKEASIGLGIRKDASATRAQLKIRATMKLVRSLDNKVVYARNIHTITSYNILDSQFTTLVSEQDARKRGLIEMADMLTRHVSLYFNRNK